jgi:PAS domain S-box-containing protein
LAGTAAVWSLVRRDSEAERRQAAFTAQGRWLHSLIENPVWAMLVLDERGCVQEMNTAAEKLLGYSSRDVLGRERFGRFFDPEEVNEELASVRRESGQPFVDLAEVLRFRLQNANATAERPWTIVRKDGLRLPTRVSISPLRDEIGRFAGSVLVLRDASEEQRVRRSADAERRRLEEFFQHAPAAVALLDRELAYLATSRRWVSDFRLEGVPLVGRPHLEVFSTLPRHWRDIYRRCLDGASEQGEEDTLTLPDGADVWIRWECRPWHEADGSIGGIAIFSEVLTAKQLQRKLSESQAMLSTAQAIAHVGSWELDVSTGKLLWSDEMKRIHRLATDVTISFEQMMAYHLGDSQASIIEAVQHAQAFGTGWDLELEIGTSARERAWIRSIGQAEMDGPRVLRLYGTVQDISERKAAEKEVLAAKDEALRLARSKADFLANMSHEIRTPLNAVIGMSALLLNTPLDSEQREFVSTVRSASDNLIELINDILDFSKVESGKLELENQPFSIHGCIESALDLVAPRAAEKQIELACWIDRSVSEILIGDVTRLRQIVINLLANAVKFTSQGEVFVSVATHEGPTKLLRVTVRDTGIGIPQDRLSRLFQTFSQTDVSTARNYGGSGLGLAISRRLVELMNGRIWVESEQGRGSRFHFEIPLPAGENSLEITDSSPLAERRVLVVEDNACSREIIQLHLESWGARVVAVPSALNALALVRQGEKFDVLIIDRSMPNMDGLQLTRQLRTLPEGLELPVILMTHLGLPSISVEDGSFSGVLTKPVKPHQLLRLLTRVFEVERAPDTMLGMAKPQFSQQIASARILVVEDDTVSQRVQLSMLKRMGAEPDLAVDGEDAIGYLNEKPFDVVLMDLQMPKMNGLDATREIRRMMPADRQPVIIAMTASVLPSDRLACIEAGMDDFISKPVNADHVRTSLERWLKQRASGRDDATDAADVAG